MERENEELQRASTRLKNRLGDVVVSSSDSDSSMLSNEGDDGKIINTRHHDLDGQFGKDYYFVTNVRSVKLILKIGRRYLFWFYEQYNYIL